MPLRNPSAVLVAAYLVVGTAIAPVVHKAKTSQAGYDLAFGRFCGVLSVW